MLTTASRGTAAYLGEVWSYRYFWMSLVKAELQRRYRRSALGLGWSLLQPISMTLVLAVVYGRVFHLDLKMFAPILLTGLAFWNYISGNVLQGCHTLLSAESYIRQQYVPTAIFPLKTVLTIGFHGLISLGVSLAFVLVTMCIFGRDKTYGTLAALVCLPATLVLLFLLGWSLAVLSGYAHVYFPDTSHVAEVGLQVLMFLTPIMYPPDMLKGSRLGYLLQTNPLSIFLRLVRDPIVHGAFPPLSDYALATGCVVLLVGCASWVLARLEHRVIFAM